MRSRIIRVICAILAGVLVALFISFVMANNNSQAENNFHMTGTAIEIMNQKVIADLTQTAIATTYALPPSPTAAQ